MPYPAFNQDLRVYGPGQEINFNHCSPNPPVNFSDVVTTRHWDRSAIISSPKLGDGFRLPTALYETSWFDTYAGLDGFLELIPDSSGPCFRSTFSDTAAFGVPIWPSVPWASNLKTRAETQALLKLQGQKVNLAQEFSRAKQTANLFNEFCGSVHDLYSAFKRNNPGGYNRAKAGADAASAGFLSYIYGWRPEASALYESAEALRAGNSDFGGFRCSVDGKSTDRLNIPFRYATKVFGSAGLLMLLNMTLKCRVRLDYKMNVPLFKALAQYGITNPAYVLWDKTPWSFVVDWAIPIGNWLNAMTADYGWDFISGTFSFRESHSAQSTGTYWDHSGFFPYTGFVTGNESSQFDSYKRDRYLSSPSPGLFMKNPLKTIHVAEGIALLHQAIK